MKRFGGVMVACAALGAGVGASAVDAQPQTDVQVTHDARGATIEGVTQVTATIVGIDPATRPVTLKTPAGKVIGLE